MNSKEFAKDFGCKIDTPMNPKSKCSVWTSPTSLKYSTTNDDDEIHTKKEHNVTESMMTQQNITNQISYTLPTLIKKLIGPIG